MHLLLFFFNNSFRDYLNVVVVVVVINFHHLFGVLHNSEQLTRFSPSNLSAPKRFKTNLKRGERRERERMKKTMSIDSFESRCKLPEYMEAFIQELIDREA